MRPPQSPLPGRAGPLLPFLALALLASCVGEQTTGPLVLPDAELTLRVGEHRVLKPDLTRLGFRSVLVDSRCPRNVVCVWEGEAVVRIWILASGQDTVFLQPRVGDPAVEAVGYRIRTIRLDPYPEDPGPIPESYYRLTLEVEKFDL